MEQLISFFFFFWKDIFKLFGDLVVDEWVYQNSNVISDKLVDCHSKLSVCFSNETKGEVELNSKVTRASVPLTPLINDKGG